MIRFRYDFKSHIIGQDFNISIRSIWWITIPREEVKYYYYRHVYNKSTPSNSLFCSSLLPKTHMHTKKSTFRDGKSLSQNDFERSMLEKVFHLFNIFQVERKEFLKLKWILLSFKCNIGSIMNLGIWQEVRAF